MRKVNPDAKKAMKLMYSDKISLAEAWRKVKGSRSMKRSKRRLSKAKNSLKLNRKKMCKKSKKCRRSKKRSRKFGSSGPGYEGQTSYPNVSAPYFGKSGGESYINPSEWFLPVTNGQVQSPQMLYKN